MSESNSNLFSLSGKRILVTGASSGIGRACSIMLSELGARLVVSGRDLQRLKETSAMLLGEGHIQSPYDLGNLSGINEWVSSLADNDPFSGLIHCAGLSVMLPVKALSEGAFRRVMEINVDSSFLLARAFKQKTVFRAPASVVFIASITGILGTSGLSAYSASKAAVIGMARSLAVEFARNKIRVNCVSPGYIKTSMTMEQEKSFTSEQIAAIEASHPLGFGTPADVAAAVSFLLSDASKWITGSNLVVDGGASVFLW